MALSKAELVEFIFDMVEKAQGKKQLKAMDIQKAVLKAHPDQDKNDGQVRASRISSTAAAASIPTSVGASSKSPTKKGLPSTDE